MQLLAPFTGWYRVTLNITNQLCDDSLQDRSSSAFNSFSSQLGDAVQQLLSVQTVTFNIVQIQ